MTDAEGLADRLVRELGLAEHPEGGWYRETWTSPETVELADGRVRPTATLIHFVLAAGQSSAWHRVASEEVWLAHAGTVLLQRGGSGARPELADVARVGTGPGESAQVVVSTGEWQRTRSTDADAWVSCLVSPGFSFDDFELAPEE